MDAKMKGDIIAYLDDARRDYPTMSKQFHHKIAVGRFALDSLNVNDSPKRTEFMKAWLGTPTAFGCNHSALEQALGLPRNGRKALSLADITIVE